MIEQCSVLLVKILAFYSVDPSSNAAYVHITLFVNFLEKIFMNKYWPVMGHIIKKMAEIKEMVEQHKLNMTDGEGLRK